MLSPLPRTFKGESFCGSVGFKIGNNPSFFFRFVRWDVGLGSNIFTQLTTISSNQAIAHPNFVAASRANDIGIITLPASIVFTSTVSPIALPAANYPVTLPLENEQGNVVGFGFTTGACK